MSKLFSVADYIQPCYCYLIIANFGKLLIYSISYLYTVYICDTGIYDFLLTGLFFKLNNIYYLYILEYPNIIYYYIIYIIIVLVPSMRPCLILSDTIAAQ